MHLNIDPMKYTFFVLALLSILSAGTVSAQNKGWVTLSGVVKNFNNQVEVEDMSEMKDLLLPDTERFFVPDSAGNFHIRFSLASANYFRMGRNILYLSSGDELTVFVDYKDPTLATFKGTHSKENEYLRETPFPNGGSFLNAGSLIRGTIDLTAIAIETAAKERGHSLATYTDLSKEFVVLETARIRADLLNSFDYIDVYFPYRYRLSKDSADSFHKNFERAITPYLSKYDKNFIDPVFLKLVVYRDIVDELIAKEKNQSKETQQVKEWMEARDLAEQIKKASDRETKKGFEPAIKKIANLNYRDALGNTLAKVLQLSNGDMAVDFTAVDQNNTPVTPGGFRGKIIYVDIWATWCGPCLEEMPAYEKLKESYRDNPNIRFISLSIDDDKEAWLQNIKKRNASGLQWIIDKATLPSYNIIGIPRCILIDQYFHILEMNAPRPSSKNLVNRIV